MRQFSSFFILFNCFHPRHLHKKWEKIFKEGKKHALIISTSIICPRENILISRVHENSRAFNSIITSMFAIIGHKICSFMSEENNKKRQFLTPWRIFFFISAHIFTTAYENPLSETIKISQKYFYVAINKDYPLSWVMHWQWIVIEGCGEFSKFNNFKGRKMRFFVFRNFYGWLMQMSPQTSFQLLRKSIERVELEIHWNCS